MSLIEERSNVMGGDFWDYSSFKSNRGNSLEWLFSHGSDRRFLASGRTALDHIIKDILIQKRIRSVYMPSYCCHTMIMPFIDNNINVIFYEIGQSKDAGFRYIIHHTGVYSSQPFNKRFVESCLDLQLNIYGFRP